MNRSIEATDQRAKRGFSDFLQLDPSQAGAGGLSDWLVAELRGAIVDGRLPAGSMLPPSRVLAAELQVSRGVVTEAYQRLSENGQVVGHARAGTVVASVPLPAPGDLPVSKATRETPDLFSATPGGNTFDLFRSASAAIDLFPGLPDVTAFPRNAWLPRSVRCWRTSQLPIWDTGIRAVHRLSAVR